LASKATALRWDLEEVLDLRFLQENAARTLADGLSGVQAARARLSQAIADRKQLPKRFTAAPVRTTTPVASTGTLDGFASGLSGIAEGEIAETSADIGHLKGELPVSGLLLHEAHEADAAGIERPGILVATPTAAKIRYVGPLWDLGNVAILEPRSGLTIVLSGLSDVYGTAGEVRERCCLPIRPSV